MFWEIFTFEIKYRSRRPATYIYFLVFMLLGLLAAGTGSTPATEKVFHNSPFVIASFNVFFSMVMMLVCSAVMGVPLYRDIEHGTKDYYLSYPITKGGYFWGRFLGSFLFVFLIGFSMSLGLYLGSVIGPLLDWVPAERMGDNNLFSYLQPYFTLAVPNLFLSSAIFFGLVAFFRDVKVIYSGSILLFIGYLLSNFLIQDIDNKALVQMLDPFAVNTFTLETRFYTPAERNLVVVPFQGVILQNRLLWTGVAFLILMATYWSFSFKRFFSGYSKRTKLVDAEAFIPKYGSKIPPVSTIFQRGFYRRIMVQLAKIEFQNIYRDNYFKAILLGGLVFLAIDYWIGDTEYGVYSQPLTVNLMALKNYNYVLFIFIIIIFYTGESVHRDKATGFAQINDALPTPNWVLYGSKLLGLSLLALFLTTIPLVVGLIIQIIKGYYHFNFPVYFVELYLISFPQYLMIVMLAFAVHVFVNNKFAGHAVGLLIWIAMFMMREFGNMNYNLFFYSYVPNYIWSDLDGISSMASGVFWYSLYWFLLGSLMLVVAAAFYTRGIFSGRKERWRVARQNFNRPLKVISILLLIGFLAAGSFIYYNVSVLNNYLASTEEELRQADYEKTLKQYEHLDQPKVTALKAIIDIFPDTREIKTLSTLSIVNKTESPIADLHCNGQGIDRYSVKMNGKVLTDITYPLIYKRGKFNFLRTEKDTSKYRIYHLPKVLQPGETAVLEISAVNYNRGFTNSMSGTDILKNGTFFSGGLPTFGYDVDGELTSDEKRKKYKLPPKDDVLPPFNDPRGIRSMLFNDDADLLTMDITVGTSKGQTAIAPGKPVKSWEKGDRIYRQYIQNSPKVDLFYDVVSAEYKVMKEKHLLPDGTPVNLELYYHPTHDKNLDRFMSAYKDGLTYFSKSYGNYQFQQLRLLEFPKYRTFAQSFPNTVSYSEGFGYTADFKPDDFDYAYFVTAHELAHQWWGHQISPNKTLGSNLVSEALAEYTALILSEQRFGRDNMKRFLKQELDNYLRGRANESKKENVFIDCNRSYQWYYKGSLILYGLSDLITKDTLNKALREFRDEFAFKENPPYPGSHDLYNAINKHVPDSLKYYLEDTWKRITLYENKVVSVTSTPKGKAEYTVTVNVSTRKMYADPQGNEKPATKMDDYIDIGIFAADETDKQGRKTTNPLYLKKHKLKAGNHSFSIVVKGKPVRAGIDPYVKLIDRIPDDNVKDL